MWFGVLPTVMAIGTIALLLADNTIIFEIPGKPFLTLLNLLQVSEAVAASKTMIVGFTDIFTPSIIAAGTISSAITKFFVAVTSVTQFITFQKLAA